MNLYHFKYFSDAIELGSLAKSARLNHVTPAAVSQAIKKLENIYSVSLIQHQQKILAPTPKGIELQRLAKVLISDFHELEKKIRFDSDSLSGEMVFATQQSIAGSFLPVILKSFRNEFPKIIPRFTLGHTSIVQRLLDTREIKFAIILDNVRVSNCSSETLYHGDFIFVKAKGYRAKDPDFITTGLTPEVNKIEKSYQLKYRKPLSVNMKIDSWGVIKKMAQEGHGIGFIPDFLYEKGDRQSLTKLNLGLPIENYVLKAVWPKDCPLDKKTKKFIQFLKLKFRDSPQ